MSVTVAILLALAVVATQVLHGGLLLPALSIPADGILILAAVIALVSLWKSVVPGSLPGMATVAVAIGYLAWRCLHAPDAYYGRTELQLILGCGLAFFASAVGMRNNRGRFVFLACIGLVALVQAITGFFQFAFGEDFSAPLGWFSAVLQSQYEGRFLSRAHGFFVNPNQFAWLMTWSALFAVSFSVWARVSVLWRVLFIYLSFVFIAATVFSGSRGGMASLLAGMVVFALLSVTAVANTRGHGRLGLIVGAVSLLVLCVGVGFTVYSSNWITQGRVDATLNVVDSRGVLLENAWRQFQISPLLGVGPGMFIYAARLFRTGGQEGDPIFVHDDWLQTLTDYGIVGFSLLLVALVILFGVGVRQLLLVATRVETDGHVRSNSVAVLSGTLSAVTAFFVHSFTDFNMHIPANALLAAVSLGFLIGTLDLSARLTVARRLQGNLARLFGGLALAVLTATAGGLLWKNALPDYESLRAQSFLEKGEVFSALAATERGLQTAPENAALLTAEGQAKYEYLSAVQASEKSTEPSLTPQSLKKSFEDSASAYALALKQQPRERRIEMGLAKSLVELRRQPEARRHLIEAIRLDPWHAMAYSAYAENLYEAGEYPRAMRILEVASTLPGWRDAADRLWEIRGELAPPPDADAEADDSQDAADEPPAATLP